MRPILFDMDGVLVHGWHSSPRKLNRWDATIQEDLGIDSAAFQRFFPTYFEPKVLCGHMSLPEALAAFLPQIGYLGSPQTIIDYWLPRDAQINQELWAIIERLRATNKVALYIATNQEHLRANYLWNEVGFKNLFDAMFFAADFKASKPEEAFFKACERRLPVGDTPPLFFDDSDLYVRAARRAGWEAHVYEDEETCLSHPFIRDVLGSSG